VIRGRRPGQDDATIGRTGIVRRGIALAGIALLSGSRGATSLAATVLGRIGLRATARSDRIDRLGTRIVRRRATVRRATVRSDRIVPLGRRIVRRRVTVRSVLIVLLGRRIDPPPAIARIVGTVLIAGTRRIAAVGLTVGATPAGARAVVSCGRATARRRAETAMPSSASVSSRRRSGSPSS